jgi:hypothetical protein
LARSCPTSVAASRKYWTTNTRTALVRLPECPAASMLRIKLLRSPCSRLQISASASHNSGSRRMQVRPRLATMLRLTNRLLRMSLFADCIRARIRGKRHRQVLYFCTTSIDAMHSNRHQIKCMPSIRLMHTIDYSLRQPWAQKTTQTAGGGQRGLRNNPRFGGKRTCHSRVCRTVSAHHAISPLQD